METAMPPTASQSEAGTSEPTSPQWPAVLAPLSSNPVSLTDAAHLSPSDPCSLVYVKTPARAPVSAVSRKSSVRSSSSAKKACRFRSKAKRAVRIAVNGLKKVFHVGSKKRMSGFVMPADYAAMRRTTSSRLSQRSRRQSARMTSTPSDLRLSDVHRYTNSRNSNHPSIILTSATVNGRNCQYVLHSHDGPVSPPSPLMKKSVRTSHPAVSHVIERPATPATVATEATIDDIDDDDWSTINSGDDAAAERTGSLATAVKMTGQIQPRMIIRRSGVEIEADPATVAAFINRIDGIKQASEKADLTALPKQLRWSNNSEMTLPFIAKSPALSLDSDAEQAGAVAGAQAEEHRLTTLAALEGVPAATPVAAAASSASIPPILLPNNPVATKKPTAHKRHLTTGDITTLGAMKQIYMPYNGSFERFNPYGEPASPVSDNKQGKQPAFPEVHAALDQAKAKRTSRDVLPKFANADSHRTHYERVESGMFDDGFAVFTLPRPANPEPPSRFSSPESEQSSTSGASFSTPSPPTNARPVTHPPAKQSTDNHIERKPVRNFSKKFSPNDNKPLSSAPERPTMTRAVTPKAIAMNDSGFPVLQRNSASCFYAQPEYQRRSLNDVEMKHKRDEAKKSAKKQEKQEKAMKVAEEQEKALRKLLG